MNITGAEKSLALVTRFSAGLESPGLKPIPEIMNSFTAELKSTSPC
jgi:hypothetical protein